MLFYYILSIVDLNEVERVLKNSNERNLFFCFLTTLILVFLRNFRLYRLNLYSKDFKIGYWKIFNFNNLGLAFNTLLPFRMGDAISMYHISKISNFHNSFSIIMIDRIFEIILPFIYLLSATFFINIDLINKINSSFYFIIF